MTVLALELGPTRFAAGRVASDVGAADIRRIPVPARAAWDSCRELLLDAAEGGAVTSVGIAATGPIDMVAGVVAPAEVAEWRTGFRIVERVRTLFPEAAVQLAFDGVCLALAERNFGATHATLDALSIAVSHRVSGGVMMGGLVAAGRTGNAGHIGHVLVPGFDEPCECGGRGCLETVAGVPAVLAWAQANGWPGTTVTELVEAVRSGAQVPVAAVGRAGTALGQAVASVAALLDLDLVVVGGVLADCGPALFHPLGAAVATHARLSYLPALRVVPSQLGDVGVLAGAGVLALATQGDRTPKGRQ
ncbi:ROK family protein [Nocardia sp. NPDC127579]|uniref:ROK family protein n=1 Tax=Nocardia sp. NPDC127579 TaxID=3345402 RepID=UPI003631B0E6